MNIPIERLEMAAKSFADSNFVKSNWNKIQKAMDVDKSVPSKMNWTPPDLINSFESLMEDRHRQQLYPYMKWIALMYINHKMYHEDIVAIWDSLIEYDKLKRKNILNDKEKNIFNLDPPGLHEVVSKYDMVISRIGEKEIKWLVKKGHADVVHQDSQMTLVSPLTFEGAKALSLKNGWCTAKEEGWFDKYTDEGTLYILIDDEKPLYQFYQFIDDVSIEGFSQFFKEVSNRFNRQLGIEGIERLSNKYPGLKRVFDVIEFGEQRISVISSVLKYMAIRIGLTDEHNIVEDYVFHFIDRFDEQEIIGLVDDIYNEDKHIGEMFMNLAINSDHLILVLSNPSEHDIRDFDLTFIMEDDTFFDLLKSMEQQSSPGDLIVRDRTVEYKVENKVVWKKDNLSTDAISRLRYHALFSED